VDGLSFGADNPEAGRDALPPRAEFQRIDAAMEGGAEDEIRRGQPRVRVLAMADVHRADKGLEAVADLSGPVQAPRVDRDHGGGLELAGNIHGRQVGVRSVRQEELSQLQGREDAGQRRAGIDRVVRRNRSQYHALAAPKVGGRDDDGDAAAVQTPVAHEAPQFPQACFPRPCSGSPVREHGPEQPKRGQGRHDGPNHPVTTSLSTLDRSREVSELHVQHGLVPIIALGIGYPYQGAHRHTHDEAGSVAVVLQGPQDPEVGESPSPSTTLVLGAVAFKLGAVPVHAWMPDVAQGAPAPVAAFVTTIPKVGGFIFLARLLMALPPDALHWRIVVAVLATATMTLGNLAALWQDDVRRLLGWSSVSQTGYGLMAVVALGLSDLAIPSLLYFLLAYAVGNVAAFGVVVQLRGRTRLADYDGLARARPWLAGALVVSFLSFIGIPPLAGFFAKLVLFGAAIEAGYGWLAVVAAVNTVISIVYYVRVLAPMYFGPRGSPVGVLSRWAGGATLTLAAAVLVIGLVSEPFIRAFGETRLLPDDGTSARERMQHANLGYAPPQRYLAP
jgi:hypothetical protein